MYLQNKLLLLLYYFDIYFGRIETKTKTNKQTNKQTNLQTNYNRNFGNLKWGRRFATKVLCRHVCAIKPSSFTYALLNSFSSWFLSSFQTQETM